VGLIGNGIRLASNELTYIGGNATTSGAYSAEVAVQTLDLDASGTFANGGARIIGVSDRAAIPEGYLHPNCFHMPVKGGGMASRGRISGSGGVSSAALAGGINALADLVGSGTISSAALQLIVNALADLVGSGDLTASITGKLEAAADLVGSGDLTAALGAIADLVASLSGTSTTTGTATAIGHMTADIVVTGELLNTANVGDAVFNAICEAGFSYGDVVRILAAVAAGKTDIVDLGGGAATVTFRDLNDTKDRVEASMTGSERTALTIDND
jgi:hypothetical protein